MKKIAVIGGGVGAMTAVYAITQTPNWAQKYDITVYQLGWRLGGKGASGRNMAQGARIEEHGLHVWAGFYENAFRHLRSCYEDLQSLGLRAPDAPLSTIEQAFTPLSHLFLDEKVTLPGRDPEWRPWLIDLPTNPLVPGSATSVPTPFDMFLRTIEILWHFWREGALARDAKDHMGATETDKLDRAFDAARGQASGMPQKPEDHRADVTGILDDMVRAAQDVVHELEHPGNLSHDATRRVLLLLDVSLAFFHGMLTSDAFRSGYNVLDQWEFSAWLRANGASELALNSVLLRGSYDFVFGYPMGNTHRGDVGAGTAIRSMSRLVLTYRGAIFHKMNAGMGDTIFTPYYQVLRAKGVKFKFFNAVSRLRLDPDGQEISALEMVEQAKPLSDEYHPLIDVKGLPCWPSEPFWDQLENGAELKEQGINFEKDDGEFPGRAYRLEKGTDFDLVLLGASLGSLGYMTQDLAAQSERWQAMLDEVKTVGTQAAQFWMRKSPDDLGWHDKVLSSNPDDIVPEPPLRTIITGFEEPLDTWADLTHILPAEDWPQDGPTSLAYFCSPSPDGQTLDGFKQETRAWLDQDLTQMWTGAVTPQGGFDDSLFYKLPDSTVSGFDAQYFRVNQLGSERYVLSVTGSLYRRLEPSDSGFANLVLAGDWTRCGLNAGCVEGATMSGIAAAATITGEDLLNVGADDLETGDLTADHAMMMSSSISAAHWPLSGFFARGQMKGVFVFFEMPRDEVAKLLPEGVFLGHSALVRPGFHPVGISLCDYYNVSGSFVPGFMAMAPYHEASFAIPFVKTRESKRGSFLYPRRLYVNNHSAIRAGHFFYAMNKAHAGIDSDDRSFRVLGPDGAPVIKAQFTQQEDPQPIRHFDAMGVIGDVLNLPFVTRRDSGHLLFNAFNLELGHAHSAPVSAHIQVQDPDPDGFPDLEVSVDPMRDTQVHGLPGAFRIWCSWSLTNPLDSRRIRHVAEAKSFVEGLY